MFILVVQLLNAIPNNGYAGESGSSVVSMRIFYILMIMMVVILGIGLIVRGALVLEPNSKNIPVDLRTIILGAKQDE